MCGIVGYLGLGEKKELLIHGLEELEYRGYDSAGLAVLSAHKPILHLFKVSGKVQALQEKARDFKSSGLGVGIAHTRWATMANPQRPTPTRMLTTQVLWCIMASLKTSPP